MRLLPFLLLGASASAMGDCEHQQAALYAFVRGEPKGSDDLAALLAGRGGVDIEDFANRLATLFDECRDSFDLFPSGRAFFDALQAVPEQKLVEAAHSAFSLYKGSLETELKAVVDKHQAAVCDLYYQSLLGYMIGERELWDLRSEKKPRADVVATKLGFLFHRCPASADALPSGLAFFDMIPGGRPAMFNYEAIDEFNAAASRAYEVYEVPLLHELMAVLQVGVCEVALRGLRAHAADDDVMIRAVLMMMVCPDEFFAAYSEGRGASLDGF
jgi:hypothetical protein